MSAKRWLVIGGAGFLGSHIVEALILRKEPIAVFDLALPVDHERHQEVEYLMGDILDEEKLVRVLQQTNPSVVFHVASPVPGLPSEVYYRINRDGTKTILSACKRARVKKIVYTSSTGVVWTGAHCHGENEEQAQIPTIGYDAYHHTKAIAERLILEANGKDGMQTVVLRPCGMFGERDYQFVRSLARVYNDGQHNIQIGDNKNLVDYLYVGNAADAHIFAADRLCETPSHVAGQVFFISNGSPLGHWDFCRMVWRELGDDGHKKTVRISRSVGLVLAILAEFWCWVTGTTTEFTRFSIRYITATHWYNIEKAQRILGYEPRVTLEEGVRRSVKWWKESGAARYAEKQKHD